MSLLRLVRPHEEPPPALHSHAMDDLRFIRQTMEEAGSFTAVPGWGMVAVGASALLTGWLTRFPVLAHHWFAAWVTEAAVALAIAATTMTHKARAANQPMFSGPGRRFALSFSPPLFAAALITLVLCRTGFTGALPGTWLLLYGTGVTTGGAFSARIVPVMGLCFMALGVIALLTPAALGEVWMVAGFGVLHLVFGALIARRHGG